ncbi:MAG: type II secretion system protein [Clostridia bacterium]|nr:type II secretion system protein [Clostridia bacterium]
MRNTNKKGFTIVELVIVVAVIAILAAVLIPTFAGIIDRANQSADQQAVANMNKLLAMNEKADDVDGVVEILIKEGYKGDLSTYFKGYELAWLASENVIVLVQDNAVVYPKANVGATGYEIINPMAASLEDVLAALKPGDTVYVSEDITAGVASDFHFNTDGNYALNLNGNTLITNVPNAVKGYEDGLVVNENANVVISNGTIEGGTEVSQVIAVYDNAKLEIVDSIVTGGSSIAVLAEAGGTVTITDSKLFGIGTNPVQNYGGTLTLNNVTIAQSGESSGEYYYNSAILIANLYEEIDGKNYLTGEQSKTEINGGNYSGRNTIFVVSTGGDVTINSGTFTGTDYVINAGYTQGYEDTDTEGKYSSVITINGGTFNGAIKVAGATELVINGGTFNCDTMTWDWLSQYVTAGKTVTLNGETYTK